MRKSLSWRMKRDKDGSGSGASRGTSSSNRYERRKDVMPISKSKSTGGRASDRDGAKTPAESTPDPSPRAGAGNNLATLLASGGSSNSGGSSSTSSISSDVPTPGSTGSSNGDLSPMNKWKHAANGGGGGLASLPPSRGDSGSSLPPPTPSSSTPRSNSGLEQEKGGGPDDPADRIALLSSTCSYLADRHKKGFSNNKRLTRASYLA